MQGDALEVEGDGTQRLPHKRLDRRLEEVAKAVGGRLLSVTNAVELALAVGGTAAGCRLGALEGGGRGTSPLPIHPRGHAPVTLYATQGGHEPVEGMCWVRNVQNATHKSVGTDVSQCPRRCPAEQRSDTKEHARDPSLTQPRNQRSYWCSSDLRSNSAKISRNLVGTAQRCL
jgi:hypothetical protein